MPLAFALLLMFGLASCAGKPPPPPPQHYFTSEQGADGELRFTFNYIQPIDPRLSRRLKQERYAEPDAIQVTLPGDGPLIDQHQLYLDLEKALDQRQLCLDGYRIDQRYSTRRGISLQGRCR
ncbi:hypothetical protein [Ferrimonas balearica]|uniref:hypothetical protein n=1 Tax=Ferrimonas balearica TaxID=44012 RepID=UPI001F1DF7D6|nr:hypothetical protein [Ferrimonas balearica]MBY6017697.1 hypothetical protein [Halomonas denitrificans]MBY6094055.1 hypothetical protein [Ferrimonas balearica]